MPINFQQIYARIREIAAGADDQKRTLEEKRDLARGLLNTYASELEYLKKKVEAATAVDSNIRCAAPMDEPLTATYPPPPSASDVTVIVLKNTGHWLMEERQDETIAALDRFLQ